MVGVEGEQTSKNERERKRDLTDRDPEKLYPGPAHDL
jgi:hypothetical protein